MSEKGSSPNNGNLVSVMLSVSTVMLEGFLKSVMCLSFLPQVGDTGGVKKTSPMEEDVFFTRDIHTHGHRDSMTESAQWAESVKKNIGNWKCRKQD